MGKVRRALVVAVAAALIVVGVAGCGDDGGGEDGAPPSSTEATAATTATTATDASATDTSATDTTAASGCPDETTLDVVNADAARGDDGVPVAMDEGAIEVVTAFADGSSGGASLVFTDYEYEADPQFGLSAPVGNPEVPDGGLILVLSIATSGQGDLVAGEYGPADAAAPDVPPGLNYEALYLGPDRILPIGEHTVTLTEVTDTTLCGEITADTGESELQVDGFPAVTGTFAVDLV